MVDRCQICGTPVSHVTVCNYCSSARETRKFFKMLNREELREARNINKMKDSDLPKGFIRKKQPEANV